MRGEVFWREQRSCGRKKTLEEGQGNCRVGSKVRPERNIGPGPSKATLHAVLRI